MTMELKRIGKSSGFIGGDVRIVPRPVLPTPMMRPAPKPAKRMAQAVIIESSEATEIKGFLQEAEGQLASIERNFSNLIVALGTEDAQQARGEAKTTVEMYQRRYNQIVGVGR